MEKNLSEKGCWRRLRGFTYEHPTDYKKKTAFVSNKQGVLEWKII